MLTLLLALSLGQALPPVYPAPYNPYDMVGAIGGGFAILCNDTTCNIGFGTVGVPNASTNVGGHAVAADHATSLGQAASASGINSVAIGQAANTVINSVAVGQGATASGSNSISIGQGSSATSTNSVAIGQTATATNTTATAVGRGSTASSTSALAVGTSSTASGASSTAIGTGTTATNTNTTALGSTATAPGDAGTAVGYFARANNSYDTCVGTFCFGNADRITLVGYSAGNNGQDGVAVGYSALAAAANCTVVGSGSRCGGVAGNQRGTAVGKSAYANGEDSVSIGYTTQQDTTANRSIGIGSNQGLNSFADTLSVGYTTIPTYANEAIFGNTTYPYSFVLSGGLLKLNIAAALDHWFVNGVQYTDSNAQQTTSIGQHAYPLATTAAKQQGGKIRIMGGIGSRYITITGSATSEGDTYQLVTDGINITFTAKNPGPAVGNQFLCTTNNGCATALAAILNTNYSSVLSATAFTNTVYLTPRTDGQTSAANVTGLITQTVTDAGGGGAFGVATDGARGDLDLENGQVIVKENYLDIAHVESANLAAGSCALGQLKFDTGGATTEMCYCQTVNVWYCWAVAVGPID